MKSDDYWYDMWCREYERALIDEQPWMWETPNT